MRTNSIVSTEVGYADRIAKSNGDQLAFRFYARLVPRTVDAWTHTVGGDLRLQGLAAKNAGQNEFGD